MNKSLSRPTRHALFLAALAFVVYFPGSWWGAPYASSPELTHAWGVDDETPLGTLAQIHNIIEPKEIQNLGYPLMHPFMVTAAYTPYMGYLWARGEIAGVSGEYPFGMEDPIGTLRVLSWISSLLSVLMGVGIVVAAYDAGRVLWGERTGIVTALLVLVSYPMLYYSRTGNVDVPVLFFIALALSAFARCLAGGFTAKRGFWLGTFAGFAVATKEPSAASFVAIPIVLLVMQLASARATGLDQWRTWTFWKPAVVGLAACFVAFGIGSGLFVDPGRFFAHVEFVGNRIDAADTGGVAFVTSYPRTLEGHIGLAALLLGYVVDAMTLPGLLLSVVGVVLVFRRRPLHAAFVLPAITYFAVLFFTARLGQLRYLMPVALTLAFFAARALAVAMESQRSALRYGATVLLVGILGLGALRGIDLTYEMILDSRYAAGAWLDRRVPPDGSIEYFGPPQKLPPVRPDVSVTRANTYMGAVSAPDVGSAAVQRIESGWSERRPDAILIIPDHSSSPGSHHSATCPVEVYDRLVDGSLGYELAASFQTDRLMPWLPRPALDYPTVNPPIRVFVRAADSLDDVTRISPSAQPSIDASP